MTRIAIKFAFSVFFCLFSARLFAQNEPVPDLGFGVQGAAFYNTTIFFEHGTDMAIQPWDGKIVMTGTVSNPPILQGVVVRFNKDGSLDTGFGQNGIVPYIIPDVTHTANSVLIQPDHSIVVGGEFEDLPAPNKSDLLVARFLENGTPDFSFGDGGSIVIVHSHWSDYGGTLALQPDNKILVVGNTTDGVSRQMSLVRLLPNGTPDNSFGVDGELYASYGLGEYCGAFNAVWHNGKILVVGEATPNNDDHLSLAVIRYESSGALDPGFGNGGVAILNTSEYLDYGTAILVLPDDKLLISGGNATTQKVFVARLMPNGTFDTSFGPENKGYSYLETCCFSGGADMVLQPDKKILLASHFSNIFGLVRFSYDGIVDEQFSLGGLYRGHNYGTKSADGVGNLAFQPDGKLVVGGTAGLLNGEQVIAVARFGMGFTIGTVEQASAGVRVQLHPNPYRESFRLVFDSEYSEPLTIRMMDLSGRTVWDLQKNTGCSDGAAVELRPDLESGVYFVQVTGAALQQTFKVIKQ